MLGGRARIFTARRPIAALSRARRVSRPAGTATATALPVPAVAIPAALLPPAPNAARFALQPASVAAAVLAAATAFAPGAGAIIGQDAQVRSLRPSGARVGV